MANYVTVASDKSKIVLLIIWFLCGLGNIFRGFCYGELCYCCKR
nr:MAG TPA: hypothetical protein [Caudoviricetes sp.]